MLRALGIFVTVTQLCEGFAPARSSVRSNGFAMRRRHALRAAEDGSEEVAYPFTSVDPKLEQTLMETVNEGIERHPVLLTAVADKTAEMLEDDRPINSDPDSVAARLENFFVGLVRHPAMLWATFLRVVELMEEDLVEKGDKDSTEQAARLREIRVAAEAVRESRKI